MSISSLTSAIKERESVLSQKFKDSKAVSVYMPDLTARANKIGINKKVMLILGAGIFAICLAFIVNAYLTQVNKHNDLSDELASVEQQAASVSAETLLLQQSIADADDQIAQLDSQIIAAQAQLTRPMWVSGIFHDLLVVAADNGVVITDGVDLTDISSARSGTETIAGATYQAISVNMKIAGTATNIYNFVDDLSLSESFTTGVLQDLTIKMDETGSSANMLFTIYSL